MKVINRRRLKGIHSGSNTNRTGTEDFLLPQAAVLPGSDAGSDGVKSTLSFVIQNHYT